MTIETFEPAPPQTITPGAIYDLPWPYVADAVFVVAVHDGARHVVDPTTCTITPESSDTSGTLLLPASVEAAYAGGQLFVVRATPTEQGWQAIMGPRERGLENQLDAIVMRVQELSAQMDTVVRADATLDPVVPNEGQTLIWSAGQLVPGPLASDIAGAQDHAEAAIAAAGEAEAAAAAAQAVALSGKRVFATVAAMIAAPNMIVGQTVCTAGYHAAGDLGGASYQITADGLSADGYGEFVLAGGLRARLIDGPLYWEHFGARADADITTADSTWTDNQPAMQAAINFAQTVNVPWFYTELQTNPLGQYLRTQVVIRPARSGLYGISAPLVPISSNRGLVIDDTAFAAKGAGWTSTQFMFSAGSVYTGYVYLNRCYFNCMRKCSGIKAEARWEITDCVVRAMAAGTGAHNSAGSRADAGIGMWLAGPVIEVLRPDIKELDNRNQGFFDQASYGAIGMYISDTDARVRYGAIGWCLEGIRIGTDVGANHKIESVHFFNGMESYADFNIDGTTRVENPGGTPATGRSYAANIVVEPSTIGGRPNIEFHDCYIDNGSVHLYNPSVSLEDCEFNSNSVITNTAQPDSGYWITCWAHAVGGANEVRVRGAKVGVKTAARRGIRWEPYLSNTWAFNNAAFETSAENLWDFKEGSFDVEGTRYRTMAGGSYALSREQNLQATGAFHGVKDEGSTGWSYFGVVGDQGVLRTPTGSMRVDSWDGTTAVTNFRATGDHVLFPRQAAAPGSPIDGYVYYDTTLAKLRVRAGGAWVNLH